MSNSDPTRADAAYMVMKVAAAIRSEIGDPPLTVKVSHNAKTELSIYLHGTAYYTPPPSYVGKTVIQRNGKPIITITAKPKKHAMNGKGKEGATNGDRELEAVLRVRPLISREPPSVEFIRRGAAAIGARFDEDDRKTRRAAGGGEPLNRPPSAMGWLLGVEEISPLLTTLLDVVAPSLPVGDFALVCINMTSGGTGAAGTALQEELVRYGFEVYVPVAEAEKKNAEKRLLYLRRGPGVFAPRPAVMTTWGQGLREVGEVDRIAQ